MILLLHHHLYTLIQIERGWTECRIKQNLLFLWFYCFCLWWWPINSHLLSCIATNVNLPLIVVHNALMELKCRNAGFTGTVIANICVLSTRKNIACITGDPRNTSQSLPVTNIARYTHIGLYYYDIIIKIKHIADKRMTKSILHKNTDFHIIGNRQKYASSDIIYPQLSG